MAREVLVSDIGVAAADPKIAVPRPDMSGPNALESLAEFGGDLARNVQEGRALKGVQEDVKRFNTITSAQEAGAKIDPNTGEILEGSTDQELQDRLMSVRAGSAQKFKEIALTNEQNGVYEGSLKARLHTERTIRDLAMQTPGFEEDIRRTAASVLGYDPMGFGMRQILDVDKPTKAKTKTDLWEEEVNLFMQQWSAVNDGKAITFQTAEKYLAQREVNNRKAEVLNSRIAKGNASFEEILGSVSTRESPLMRLYNRSQQKLANDEGWDWKDSLAIQNEVDFLKSEYKRELLLDAERADPDALRDQAAMDRLDDTVNRLFDPLAQIALRSTATEFLTRKGAELELLGQDFIRRVAPGLSLISDGLKDNQAAADQLMEIFYSVSTDPTAALFIQQNSELRALFGDSQEPMAWLRRSAINLGYGGKAGPTAPLLTDPEDIRKQNVLDAQLFKELWTKGTPEQRAEHVKIVSEANPKLVLGVMAADPQSFNRLSEEARLTVATEQAVELQAIIRDAARTITESGREIRLSETTGQLVEVSERRQGGKTVESFTSKSDAVKRYNMVHLNMYKNPSWRNYLTNNGVGSELEVSSVVAASINSIVIKERLRELEDRKEWLIQRTTDSSSAGRSGASNSSRFKEELSQVESSIEDLNKKNDRVNAELIRGKAILERGVAK